MAESIYGQHFCSTPAITQFAAVFWGWQHCLHPIIMCGWIHGKSQYLPGFADGVMMDILWLFKWSINVSFKTGLCFLMHRLDLALSLFFSLSQMQAEKRKTGKHWLIILSVSVVDMGTIQCFVCVSCDMFIWVTMSMWFALRPIWIFTIAL